MSIVTIERCIKYNDKCPGSPYLVYIRRNNHHRYGSFSSLKQARLFRDKDISYVCLNCGVRIKQGRYCTNCWITGKASVTFSKWAPRLIGEQVREDKDNLLLVRCYKCGKWYKPSWGQVDSRWDAINGRASANNFYCSQHCKNTCDVYNRSILFKHQVSTAVKARCNQRTNRQALIDNQIDQYGYTFCEKCGSKTSKLAIHHNIMVSKDITLADDLSHQLLLCNNCHTHKGC